MSAVSDARTLSGRGGAVASRLRAASPELLWALAAMVLSLLAAVCVWHLWDANLRIPLFGVGGDAAWNLETVKGMLQHGWYETNSTLAAPFGQVNYDFPAYIAETGKVALIKLLGLVLSNPVVILNLFIIGGFPLVALTAYLVLRRLRLSRGVSLVCAVLFAASPIHFALGPIQTWLGFYVGVPVSGFLVLAALGEEPMFTRRKRSSSRSTAWLTRTSVLTIVMCLFVGLMGLDYAEFTCLLVGIGAVLVYFVRRRATVLLRALVVIVTIAIPVVASAAPDLVYRAEHGTNELVAHRYPYESLVYGVQPAQLIMPQLDDRIGLLAKFSSKVDGDLERSLPGVPPNLALETSIGLVSAIGLVWLLWVVIGTAVGRVRKRELETQAGTAVLLSILLAMGSGGSLLFAYLVTAQLRVWSRISILIAFFAVVGLGLLLERGRAMLARRGHGPPLALALGTLVLAFGVFEGTSDRFVPAYQAQAAVWRNDAGFVAGIQHSLPRDAMVLVLPYIEYPEGQLPTGLTSYEPLIPYLHSTTLRWSAGAIKGRPTDWLAAWNGRPVGQLVEGATAAGFDGVYILRNGYADHGAQVVAEIQAATKTSPVGDAAGTAVFFNLLAYARRLRATTPPARLAALARATIYPYGPPGRPTLPQR